MSLLGVGRRAATALIAVILAVVLIVVATVAITLRRPVPDYSGTATVAGLSAEVTVIRNEQGVPQIYADNPDDLFYAQGFVNAQDRFFQMDLRRHITAGRLSEMVGEAGLPADRMMRTLGVRRVAEQEFALVSAATRRYLQAYADGVNGYLEGKSPSDLGVAYTVLGVKADLAPIEPWSPVDSLAWLKAMAWDLKGNYDQELGRAISYSALDRRVDLVEEVYPSYPYAQNAPILPGATASSNSPLGAVGRSAEAVTAGRPSSVKASSASQPSEVKPSSEMTGAAAREVMLGAAEALRAVPPMLGKQGVGSNSWVVAGRFTESGKPLLANDPHLGASLPSVWSQVGLHCRTVSTSCPFDVSGFTLAGLPGVVIGHNAKVAWGFTNMGADVTDFFLERVTGNTVVRSGRSVPLSVRTETLRVAGGEPVSLQVRSSSHGPLVSDVSETLKSLQSRERARVQTPASSLAVALRWTALDPGRTADAMFGLNTAGTFEQFRAAASRFDVPAQNLVYADTSGRIGYQAPGRIPVRGTGTARGLSDGTWPRLGWDAAWDWKGYVPFARMPHTVDPSAGMIVTANQAVTPAGSGPFLSRDFDAGYRATRIRTLLNDTVKDGKLTVARMNEIQNDELHPFADTLIPHLLRAPITTSSLNGQGPAVNRAYINEALTLLRRWDRRNTADSAAAAYYNAVWSNLIRLTFADQLPRDVSPNGGDETFLVMSRLLKEPNNKIWDDARTPGLVESRDQILSEAVYAARVELTSIMGKNVDNWTWGQLHQLRLQHAVVGGEGVPGALRWLINPEPVRLGGGSSIVNATSWNTDTAENYDVTALPSMRMVVDLSNLDNSTWVDLTGVSGHPHSSNHTDQLETWADGRTYPWRFTRAAVDRAAENTLTLTPENGD